MKLDILIKNLVPKFDSIRYVAWNKTYYAFGVDEKGSYTCTGETPLEAVEKLYNVINE